METSTSEVEANWSWARKHLQGKTRIVNLYYRRQLLDSIKVKLSSIGDVNDPLLRRFEEGCFGHLLGWKCGISNCQALNALIGRQIVSPHLPEHVLLFRINETNIRFSFPEFALVTGLHFGASTFNPADPKHRASNTGVFQRFCGGKEMDLDALWCLFEGGTRPSEATDEDYLKVANLLFLYVFAMGNDLRRKPDNFAWVLVDNLVAWNKFPWGAYCFRAFLHYFKQMKTSGQKYHFFGPAWSLQIWALEAIPSLAGHIGKIADQDILPRCLKWTFKKSRQLDFHKLLKTVTECHVKLKASPMEKVQGYYTSSEDLSWQSVGYVEPVNTLNLPAELAAPDVKKRKGKRIVPSDGDESDVIAPAPGRRKQRLDDRTESCSSSTNHICQIRENRIVEKLEARVMPKLIDFLKNCLVPDMMAMMKSLVDQQPRQPQTQLQSPLNHESGVIGVDDQVQSKHPNLHPQPPVYGDGQQPQHHTYIALEHVETGGDDHGETQQPRPQQQPPSVVESEVITSDVQGQSEQSIPTSQATVNADQMHHSRSQQPPPSSVESEKITGDVEGQSEQPIPTPQATINTDQMHHSSPTPQPQLKHHQPPVSTDEPEVILTKDMAICEPDKEMLEPATDSVDVDDMSEDAISKYFNMNLVEAARKLNVGTTKLKKRCRELGIERWPGRKLMSIDRLMKNEQEHGMGEIDDAVCRHKRKKKLIELVPNMKLGLETKKRRQHFLKKKHTLNTQPQQHAYLALEHVEIGGDDHGETQQPMPQQQPPSVVETEEFTGDFQRQSEQPIPTPQATVNANQMRHSSSQQQPPSFVESEKITGNVEWQSEQPISTPQGTGNADQTHHPNPTLQPQLKHHKPPVSIEEPEVMWTKDMAICESDKEMLEPVTDSVGVDDMSEDAISKYFNMNLAEAARKLNVGTTKLKKRCRELGIERWPGRKLRSIDRLKKIEQELGMGEIDEAVRKHKRKNKLIGLVPNMELVIETKKLRQHSLIKKHTLNTQPQQHAYLALDHVEIGGDDHGKIQQPMPQQQPPSVVETEEITGDVQGQSEQPILTSQVQMHHSSSQQPPSSVESGKITGDVEGQSEQPILTSQVQMHHSSSQQPPSSVESGKITGDVEGQSEQPIPTLKATINADQMHHSSPTPQPQLKHHQSPVSIDEREVMLTKDVAICKSDKEVLELATDSVRVDDMSEDMISKYFNMNLVDAARKLNVGMTKLKRRCRELGIKRWPCRKLRSIDRLIKNEQELGRGENDEAICKYKRRKKLIELVPNLELGLETKKLRQHFFKKKHFLKKKHT